MAQCVVVAYDGTAGKYLTAYVVPSGEAVDVPTLRECLSAQLPEYMVPSAFVVLPTMPLNASGKVDRKALPVPDRSNLQAEHDIAEPTTNEEIGLASIWKELLNLDAVGIRDSFFELGGHSLLAVRLATKIRDRFGIALRVSEIFRELTIERLAEVIVTAKRASSRRIPTAELDCENTLITIEDDIRSLPVSDQQLHWIARREAERRLIKSGIQASQQSSRTLVGLRLKGDLSYDAFGSAFHDLVRRHESLRTRFSKRGDTHYQEVLPKSPTGLKVTDLELLGGRRRSLEEFLQFAQTTPLDRERGALFHAWLVRIGPQDHVLVFLADHIICDAWSVAVLYRDLSLSYNAGLTGTELHLQPPVQPLDYFAALQTRTDEIEASRRYWETRLKDPPPSFLSPNKDGVISCSSLWVEAPNDGELLSDLLAIAKQEHCSPFVVLLTLYGLYQHYESDLDEVMIYYISAGRNMEAIADTVGCMLGGGIARIRPEPEETFSQLLARVWQDHLRDQERGAMTLPGSMLPDSESGLKFGSRAFSSVLNAQLGLRLPHADFNGLTSEHIDMPDDATAVEFHHQLLALPNGMRALIDPDLITPDAARDGLVQLRELTKHLVSSTERTAVTCSQLKHRFSSFLDGKDP